MSVYSRTRACVCVRAAYTHVHAHWYLHGEAIVRHSVLAQVGLVETLCITLMIGNAVDYALHFGVACAAPCRCSRNPRNRIGHAVAPQRCALATWHYTCARLRGPGIASHRMASQVCRPPSRLACDHPLDRPHDLRYVSRALPFALVRTLALWSLSTASLHGANCGSECADQCDSQRCGLPGRCDADDGRGELDALLLPGVRTMLFDGSMLRVPRCALVARIRPTERVTGDGLSTSGDRLAREFVSRVPAHHDRL